MERENYLEIKNELQRLCKENRACEKGYAGLLKSENLTAICAVMFEYWADMLGAFYKPFVAFLTEFYPKYKDDFNRAGLFFNEAADRGKVVVTESIMDVAFNGDATVYAYGNAEIIAYGHTNVVAHDKSVIILGDQARCQAFDKSRVSANLFTTVSGYDFSRIEADGSVDVTAGGRCTVAALAYKRILACGNAQIYSRRKINIRILDQSNLIICNSDIEVRNAIEYESSGD
jgi:hypothetical protein